MVEGRGCFEQFQKRFLDKKGERKVDASEK